jgi:hypothetical protein
MSNSGAKRLIKYKDLGGVNTNYEFPHYETSSCSLFSYLYFLQFLVNGLLITMKLQETSGKLPADTEGRRKYILYAVVDSRKEVVLQHKLGGP